MIGENERSNQLRQSVPYVGIMNQESILKLKKQFLSEIED